MRRYSRQMMVLLAVVAAVGSTAGLSAGSVKADDNALILPGGGTSVTLGPNAVLRVDGRLRYFTNCDGGINDFVYPATDVYIVDAADNPADSPTLFPELEDVTGTPSTILQAGGTFVEQIIAITGPSGMLGPGTYSVVYDTCQDGRFQASKGDQVFANAITVAYPAVIPPEDPAILTIKHNATTDWGRWQEIGNLFDSLVSVDNLAGCTFGEVKDCLAALAIWADSPSIEQWAATLGKLKDVEECVGEDLGACFGLLADYWGFSTTPIRDHVIGGAKSLIANQTKAFFGIAADPPRADFTTPTSVMLDFPVPIVHGAGEPIDTIAEFATALEREQAMWAAWLAAIERYQGARAAGDVLAAAAQARSAASLADALAAASPVTVGLLSDVFAATATAIPGFDTVSQAGHDRLFRFATSGFLPAERRFLANAGMTSSDAVALAVEAGQLAAEQAPVRAPYMNLGTLDALTADQPARSADLRQSAADLRALADSIIGTGSTAIPTVSVASVVGVVGSPVTLVATAAPGSTIVWDLDADGSFDDATGATTTVTYRRSGHRVIAVAATAADAPTVTAHALVDVSTSNAPPTIVSAAPMTDADRNGSPDPWAAATVGTTTSFTVAASDPESEPLTYEWFVDGTYVVAASGPTFEFTPTSADRGAHTVSVTVSDPHPGNIAQQAWRVTVSDPDADGDGWAANAAADCDDADGDVSPSRIEQLFNGIDDDCDAATADAPPGLGEAGEVWSWGQFYGSGRGDNPTPGPLTAVQGAVKIASWFRHSYALLNDGTVLGWGNPNDGVGGFPYGAASPKVYDVGAAAGVLGGVVDITDGGPAMYALRADGRVVSWGYEYSTGSLASGTTVYARAYPDFVLGPDTDGSGSPDPIGNVVRIFQMGEAGIAQQADGTLLQWGRRQCQGNTYPAGAVSAVAVPETALTEALPNLVQAEGFGNSNGSAIFRLADGSVFICGLKNSWSEFGDNHVFELKTATIEFGPDNPAVDVAVRGTEFWVVTADGRVWVRTFDAGVNAVPGCTASICGFGVLHEFPMPDGTPAIDVETDASEVSIRRVDGSLVTFGANTAGATGHPVATNPISNVVPAPVVIDGYVTDSSPSGWNGLALAIPNATITAAQWVPPRPDIDVDAVGASGPEGGTATASVVLGEPVGGPVTVDWSFDGGSGTVTIPAGSTSAEVELPLPARDGVWGADRHLPFSIGAVSAGLTIAGGVADVLVTDADPVPTLTITPVVFDEGDDALVGRAATLTLSGPAGVDLRAHVTSSDGSAVAGTDFKTVEVVLDIPAGAISVAAPVVLYGDSSPQPERSFELTAMVDDTPITATVVAVIHDDDPVVLSATGSTVTPGMTATVALEVPHLPTGEEVVVRWATQDGSATSPTDFAPAAGTTTIIGGVDGTGQATIEIETRPPGAGRAGLVQAVSEAKHLTVTLDASSVSRAVLGPSSVPLALAVVVEPAPTTSVTPTTVTPTTGTPTTSVPITAVPTTSVPITAVPATSVPATTAPVSTLPRTGGDPRTQVVWAMCAITLGAVVRRLARAGSRWSVVGRDRA